MTTTTATFLLTGCDLHQAILAITTHSTIADGIINHYIINNPPHPIIVGFFLDQTSPRSSDR